jgi:hypothetical protein
MHQKKKIAREVAAEIASVTGLTVSVLLLNWTPTTAAMFSNLQYTNNSGQKL